MKSFFMVVLLCTVACHAFAQWNPNGATTGNIYYNGGNVGIGRQDPQYLLDVTGVIRSNGYLRITGINVAGGLIADDGVGSTIFSITRQANNEARFQSYGFHTFYSGYNAGTERMRIADNGKVGIGVTSPYSQSKLHVKADINSPWTILSESNTNTNVMGIGHNGEAGQISVSYLGSGTFSPLQFRTSNLERMTILPNGNVGIGTPNPNGKLDINYAGGQLRLSGGTVAGGVWTNATDILYIADWNTASKGISINMTTGDVKVGSEAGVTTGYGAKLHLLGNSLNGDALWMSRYNNGDNKSELRVNIGDDFGQQEDMFTVGTHHWNGGEWKPHLSVHASGRVGIGTTNPDAKLAVKGTVHAEEVKVDLNVPGPDYVFEPAYQLPTLTEIESYIKANKHLPEVPSAKEMETNGINLSEMNMLLLKKVEELTLHLIEMKDENQKHKEENTFILQELNILKDEVSDLKHRK